MLLSIDRPLSINSSGWVGYGDGCSGVCPLGVSRSITSRELPASGMFDMSQLFLLGTFGELLEMIMIDSGEDEKEEDNTWAEVGLTH